MISIEDMMLQVTALYICNLVQYARREQCCVYVANDIHMEKC